jgi:hypothetical protein
LNKNHDWGAYLIKTDERAFAAPPAGFPFNLAIEPTEPEIESRNIIIFYRTRSNEPGDAPLDPDVPVSVGGVVYIRERVSKGWSLSTMCAVQKQDSRKDNNHYKTR